MSMYERVYFQAQDALDEILGPRMEDGAGGGLVADIRLVAAQRDKARDELDRLKAARIPTPTTTDTEPGDTTHG